VRTQVHCVVREVRGHADCGLADEARDERGLAEDAGGSSDHDGHNLDSAMGVPGGRSVDVRDRRPRGVEVVDADEGRDGYAGRDAEGNRNRDGADDDKGGGHDDCCEHRDREGRDLGPATAGVGAGAGWMVDRRAEGHPRRGLGDGIGPGQHDEDLVGAGLDGRRGSDEEARAGKRERGEHRNECGGPKAYLGHTIHLQVNYQTRWKQASDL